MLLLLLTSLAAMPAAPGTAAGVLESLRIPSYALRLYFNPHAKPHAAAADLSECHALLPAKELPLHFLDGNLKHKHSTAQQKNRTEKHHSTGGGGILAGSSRPMRMHNGSEYMLKDVVKNVSYDNNSHLLWRGPIPTHNLLGNWRYATQPCKLLLLCCCCWCDL
jgi:hypothetical protein